ncbi:hypothetical protein pipiens_008570 [Culex pipiens pipiens]|uniref:SecA DEAD-like N-terminal domain-containing protein n=1 Tax=Culex pipiens pipiens TaxID=38569 RepID=A0ABD1DH83_CULPP
MDSMESLRVITHNTIKYLALGAPFFNSKHGLDREITLSQINTMKRATVGGQMSFLDYRDLVEVFGQYWKQRGEFADGITAKLPGEYFKKHVANIQDILLQCMRDALRKNVGLAELISFCRAYEELLVDLLDVPLDWYVRLEQGETQDFVVKRELVELVKNNWQDSEHKCYRVTNIVKFTARLTSEEEEHPKHYILETVKNLLKSIYNMMVAGNWKGGARLTELEQISSASLMIASVRSCLIYLKEQPDYIDFDKYLEENSKPFETLSEKCTSFEEFKKRVLMIKESFWYIRNQNAIGIDEALRLFNLNNDNNFNEEYLRAAFQKYNELFELYMAGNETLTSEEKIKHIVTEVKATVVNKLTPEWNFEFKQNVLPRLLAGMGAVWALHASKDVASTGHYLKPHCIQVLGVLRLLSADNEDQGVMKHLAQILTGQGKSLVLGMTATLLALCGHSVTIMCYSGYLATRDQQDFDEFYNHFSYEKKVVQQYYNITESSVMPSYFGSSNLQFDENRDVKCYQTITEWMNMIFSRINAMVNAKRAVLVIFDTEETINSFKQQFGGKLDRLNVLTINTNPNDKERLITESGVSRTITLATREMGRGVDYKSSVTVEKKGGVHVIQTFFSLDVKEETQIKGRTARKDHRGSYEMILCYVDLKGLNLKVGDCASRISYQKLNEARDKYNLKNDNTRDIKVQKSNRMHEKTIEFYGKL